MSLSGQDELISSGHVFGAESTCISDHFMGRLLWQRHLAASSTSFNPPRLEKKKRFTCANTQFEAASASVTDSAVIIMQDLGDREMRTVEVRFWQMSRLNFAKLQVVRRT